MIIDLTRDWEGPAYSPNKQQSEYPVSAAGFTVGCCAPDRVIVASSVTNSGEGDVYLQIRDTNDEGPLIISIICPAGQTTNFGFPVRTQARPWVQFSSTPFGNDPVADFSGIGATFWTR